MPVFSVESHRAPNSNAKPVSAILMEQALEATARYDEATREFEATMGPPPSGLPHPDGIQRIKNASSNLSIARKEMTTAHNCLHDYLSRGVLPEDLKQAG